MPPPAATPVTITPLTRRIPSCVLMSGAASPGKELSVVSNFSNMDVNGHQRRTELSEKALIAFIDSARKIGEIAVEQRQQSEQLTLHNQEFQKLNARMDTEAKEREKSDRKEHRFTIWMALLSFALGLFADHLPEIIEWAKSLFRSVFG